MLGNNIELTDDQGTENFTEVVGVVHKSKVPNSIYRVIVILLKQDLLKELTAFAKNLSHTTMQSPPRDCYIFALGNTPKHLLFQATEGEQYVCKDTHLTIDKYFANTTEPNLFSCAHYTETYSSNNTTLIKVRVHFNCNGTISSYRVTKLVKSEGGIVEQNISLNDYRELNHNCQSALDIFNVLLMEKNKILKTKIDLANEFQQQINDIYQKINLENFTRYVTKLTENMTKFISTIAEINALKDGDLDKRGIQIKKQLNILSSYMPDSKKDHNNDSSEQENDNDDTIDEFSSTAKHKENVTDQLLKQAISIYDGLFANFDDFSTYAKNGFQRPKGIQFTDLSGLLKDFFDTLLTFFMSIENAKHCLLPVKIVQQNSVTTYTSLSMEEIRTGIPTIPDYIVATGEPITCTIQEPNIKDQVELGQKIFNSIQCIKSSLLALMYIVDKEMSKSNEQLTVNSRNVYQQIVSFSITWDIFNLDNTVSSVTYFKEACYAKDIKTATILLKYIGNNLGSEFYIQFIADILAAETRLKIESGDNDEQALCDICNFLFHNLPGCKNAFNDATILIEGSEVAFNLLFLAFILRKIKIVDMLCNQGISFDGPCFLLNSNLRGRNNISTVPLRFGLINVALILNKEHNNSASLINILKKYDSSFEHNILDITLKKTARITSKSQILNAYNICYKKVIEDFKFLGISPVVAPSYLQIACQPIFLMFCPNAKCTQLLVEHTDQIINLTLSLRDIITVISYINIAYEYTNENNNQLIFSNYEELTTNNMETGKSLKIMFILTHNSLACRDLIQTLLQKLQRLEQANKNLFQSQIETLNQQPGLTIEHQLILHALLLPNTINLKNIIKLIEKLDHNNKRNSTKNKNCLMYREYMENRVTLKFSTYIIYKHIVDKDRHDTFNNRYGNKSRLRVRQA